MACPSRSPPQPPRAGGHGGARHGDAGDRRVLLGLLLFRGRRRHRPPGNRAGRRVGRDAAHRRPGGVRNAPPVFAAAGGDQLAIVGALQANPNGSALLVPKGSPIHSVAQLRGKKIAVAQGSSADYHLLTVLNKAGLSVHDVTLVYLQPAAGLAALSSGHVDAWDIWSPFVEEGQTLDGATAIVTGQGYGSPYSFTVASRAALADPAKAAAIRDYLALIAQAHRWANNHLSAWAAVWAKASGLPLTVMTKAASDDSSLAVPITPAVIASEQQVANAFTTSGLIPVHVNFSQFVDTSFNTTTEGN